MFYSSSVILCITFCLSSFFIEYGACQDVMPLQNIRLWGSDAAFRKRTPDVNNISNHWNWESTLDRGSLRSFPTYNEAMSLLDKFMAFYPDSITRFRAGVSYEGRPLWAYRLHHSRSSTGRNVAPVIYDGTACLVNKSDTEFNLTEFDHALQTGVVKTPQEHAPRMLITSLHHAREPASLTVGLYFVGRLLSSAYLPMPPTEEPEAVTLEYLQTILERNVARYLLTAREIIYVPFVNPDGYIAIEKTRNYSIRKNRRPTCFHFLSSPERHGVDLNRNYDFKFVNATDPCDTQEFEGAHPFSEPETKAIKCLVDSMDFRTALNFHSFGGIWTRPYNCCNGTELPTTVGAVYDEIKKATGVDILERAPRVPALMYEASGEADDWMLGKRHVISMSPEVGPEHLGFWPPALAIRNISMESYWKIIAVAIKTGAELTALAGTDPSKVHEDTRAISLRIRNTGLAGVSNQSRLVVLHASSSVYDTLKREVPSTAEEILDDAGYVPFPWDAAQPFKTANQNDLRKLNVSSHHARLEDTTSFENDILVNSALGNLAPQQTSSTYTFSYPLGKHSLSLCVIEDSGACYCGWWNGHNSRVTIPLAILDARTSDSCHLLTRALTTFTTNEGAFDIVPTSLSIRPSIVNYHLEMSTRSFAFVLPWLFLDGLCIVAFVVLGAFILSSDVEEQPHSLVTRVAHSIALFVSSSLCCFPCCRRTYHRLKRQQYRDVSTAMPPIPPEASQGGPATPRYSTLPFPVSETWRTPSPPDVEVPFPCRSIGKYTFSSTTAADSPESFGRHL